jgi:hypothetical protein
MLMAALGEYAAKAGLVASRSENGKYALMPGDIIASVENGKLECNDPATKEALAEIIMEMPIETRSQEGKAIVPNQAKTSNVGQMRPISRALGTSK